MLRGWDWGRSRKWQNYRKLSMVHIVLFDKPIIITFLNSGIQIFCVKSHNKNWKLPELFRLHAVLSQPPAFPHLKGHILYVHLAIILWSCLHRNKHYRVWCEFLEAAFFTHNSLVNRPSLKSLSLLLINQPSLARSLLTTKSHDQVTETWQTTTYVGELKLLKRLNLYFVGLLPLGVDGMLLVIQEAQVKPSANKGLQSAHF